MRRGVVLTAILIASAVAVAALTAVLCRDRWATAKLTELGNAACATCRLEVGGVQVAWDGITVDGLIFNVGADGERRRYRLVVERARVVLSWRNVLRGRVHLDEVDVRGPQVTMIDFAEGRAAAPAAKDAQPPSKFDVDVDRLIVADGTFTYVRDRKDTHAVVGFRKLHLTAEDFGTSPARRDRPVFAKLKGQLGLSGEMRIEIKAHPTAPAPQADVEIWFNDQNLADLSDFFEPNAGVKLSGALQFAHATSHLDGARLKTRARAVFEDFDLEVEPHADRGAWSAFFTNLGVAIGVKQGNVELSEAQQTRVVTNERRAHEPLVAFILRGIKEAVISVAKKPAARSLTE